MHLPQDLYIYHEIQGYEHLSRQPLYMNRLAKLSKVKGHVAGDRACLPIIRGRKRMFEEWHWGDCADSNWLDSCRL